MTISRVRFSRSRSRFRLLTVGLAATTLAVLVAQPAGAVLTSALTPAPSKAKLDVISLQDIGCNAGYATTTFESCFFGTEGAETVALIGDSHGSHIFPGVLTAVEDRGWGVTVLTKGACPVADVTKWDPAKERIFTECDVWRGAMMQRLLSERPDVVVISSSYNPSMILVDRTTGLNITGAKASQQWVLGMRRTVKAFTAVGSRVLVLRDVPLAPYDVPACIIANGTTTKCTVKQSAYVPEKSVVKDIALVRFADFTPRFCSKLVCRPNVGRVLVYRDRNHLTKTFALTLSGFLGVRLDLLAGPNILTGAE